LTGAGILPVQSSLAGGFVPKRSSPQLAKLTRPRLHKAVARKRLFALLDEAREAKPAICVVGPPGAGKTTLVASWLDARGIKGIWYQVDPGDADIAASFTTLVRPRSLSRAKVSDHCPF
jgi:ATP/maltotriose-dependent transcriptional regulator MalT